MKKWRVEISVERFKRITTMEIVAHHIEVDWTSENKREEFMDLDNVAGDMITFGEEVLAVDECFRITEITK